MTTGFFGALTERPIPDESPIPSSLMLELNSEPLSDRRVAGHGSSRWFIYS